MKTIAAIDLGKSKSVFCKMDTIELKPRFFTLRTSPQKFHDIFVELDQQNSIVLFNKSDKNDAHRLAVMYHCGNFPEAYVPVKQVRQKRSLIYYRQKIVNRCTQVKNSIRALTTTAAIDLPSGKECWTQKHRKQLQQLARPLHEIDDPHRNIINQLRNLKTL